MAFYAEKRKGKIILTSLPSLWRKCNEDLAYERVTDVPYGMVKLPSLLIIYMSAMMLVSSPQNSHSVSPERISTKPRTASGLVEGESKASISI